MLADETVHALARDPWPWADVRLQIDVQYQIVCIVVDSRAHFRISSCSENNGVA